MKYAVWILLLAGCSQPQPDPRVIPFPPKPVLPRFASLSPPGISPSLRELVFNYPSNACNLNWILQGSSNLVDWVDLTNFSAGCPTNDWPVNQGGPVGFFRLRADSP